MCEKKEEEGEKIEDRKRSHRKLMDLCQKHVHKYSSIY